LASRKRVVKQPFPDVLAVAGTSVLASENRYTGDHSFQDIRMDCSKGTKAIVLEDAGRDPSAVPDDFDSCPRLQAPATKLHVSSTA
jgi:hypothetical protein